MADLSIDFAGIKAPNPFWLASAPPTDKAYNVVRAFEAGWGGVFICAPTDAEAQAIAETVVKKGSRPLFCPCRDFAWFHAGYGRRIVP